MSKTQENLQEAFAGESQANRKYLAFAKQAHSEGYPQVAKLFEGCSGGRNGSCPRTPARHERYR